MTGILMDGRTYRVRVVYNTLEESASIKEGPNAGDMLSGRHERDLIGTCYSHSMDVEPDPQYPGDYDDFFDAVTAPMSEHTVTMPHGQSTITYQAQVYTARRRSAGTLAGRRRWKGINITFQAAAPQRVPE